MLFSVCVDGWRVMEGFLMFLGGGNWLKRALTLPVFLTMLDGLAARSVCGSGNLAGL